MDGLMTRILILGGTTEAAALARLIAGDPRFSATLSLAGRTASPAPQSLPMRVGGFGGMDGLMRWLEQEAVAAVVDATHPYAVHISANAVDACARLGLPLATLIRPQWEQQPGDRWTEAESAEAAAGLLATDIQPRRVFLSLGRLELGVFSSAPQHDYLARLIDPPEGVTLPPRISLIFARGPFDRDTEAVLLESERIEVVVSKNSGGAATYAKIEAAREAGLPVILIARPEKPYGYPLDSPEQAVGWLEMVAGHGAMPPSRRGV
jgi:precorrin-6A/cobalt-precorrin-6A reductase